jgi:hypothetical protein
VTRKSGDIEFFQRHLQALRRGVDEVAVHIATSREAIERSLALLPLINKIESEQMRRKLPMTRLRRGMGE